MKSLNLSVCNIGLYDKFYYLPYIYARLRTFIEVDFDKPLDITWQRPIFCNYDINNDSPAEIFNEIEIEQLNLFLISNYVWNYRENLKIIEYVKKINPKCFILIGGPEVEYLRHDVFDTLPGADAICYTEIETVVPEFLYNYQNNLNTDIDGIILKNNPTKTRIPVPRLECSKLKGRPYLHMFDELQTYAKHTSDQQVLSVIFETNRGCPYSCAFCDWGSATNSKIKKFDKKYVLDEIDAVCKLGVTFVMIADANYGMFEDDLIYIKKFIEHKQTADLNLSVVFQSAKNKKDIATQATLELFKAGMTKSQQLGLQHTDPAVLKIMNRDNIKTVASIKEVSDFLKHGIPVIPSLIVGCPGDTIEKWKKAITDMMQMGFHEDIKFHDYQLLPNAPAMNPEYMEKYQISYIEKIYPDFENQTGIRDITPAKYVSSSFSFDEKDYVEMLFYVFFYQAVHLLGPFRWPAIYGYHSLGISYKDFYDRVVEFTTLKKPVDDMKKTLYDYVLNGKKNKLIEYNHLNIRLDNFLYLYIIDNMDSVLDELKANFHETFGDLIDDLIKFSRFMSVNHIEFHPVISLNYDFKNYFLDAIYTMPYQRSAAVLESKPVTYYNNGYIGTMFSEHVSINKINTSKAEFIKFLESHGPHFRNKMFYFNNIFEN